MRRRTLHWLVPILVLVGAALVITPVVGIGVARSRLPRVVGFQPAAVRDVSLRDGIRIAFDQAMDHGSVERAFQIQPALPGNFTWEGDALRFQPSGPVPPDTEYTVELTTAARGLFQQPLAQPFRTSFRTAGKFGVAYTSPAADSTEIATDDFIAVQFSRPVVPLSAVGTTPASPLQIQPAVEGRGEWLNTSTFLFRPAGGLAPSTTYRVSVPAGLQNLDGQALETAYDFAFTTVFPAVQKVTPENNERYAAPQPDVTVVFNQPMNHESAQRSFRLTAPGGEAANGSFRWTDDRTMVFRPDARLRGEAAYSAVVLKGARAANGRSETKDDFQWSFTPVGAPRVASTTPPDGASSFDYTAPVVVTFSQPVDTRSVTETLRIEPEPSRIISGFTQLDTQLRLNLGLEPSTAYTVRFSGARDRFGQPLPGDFALRFTTAPRRPAATFVDSGFIGYLSAYGAPRAAIDAVNVPRVDFVLYSLDEPTFLRLATNQISQPASFTPPESAVLRRWSAEASAPLNESRRVLTDLRADPSAPLAPGLYFLRVSAPGATASGRALVVSRTNLALKRAQEEVLVWATDLASGAVAPGLQVAVKDPAGQTLVSGTTDADGVFRAQAPPPPTSRDARVFAFASGGGDFAVAGSDWADGIRPFDFNLSFQTFPQPVVGAVYTDRPVYRPGDTVSFQGTLRLDRDGAYSVPPPSARYDLSIRDARGRAVYTETAKLDEFGAFNGKFALGADATLGFYQLNVNEGTRQVAGVSFNVAEFRKPEFLVEVTTDKARYVAGDEITATVQATLYLGAPLADAKVHWRALRANYSFQPDVAGLVGFYEYTDTSPVDPDTPNSGLLTEGEGQTDADGRFTFRFKPDLTKYLASQRLTLEATVTDQTNQEVSGRQAVIVHKGELYIGLRPERYAGAAGQPQTVNLLTVDLDGKRLPNVEVTVDFAERRWFSVQRQVPGGGFVWTSRFEDTPLGSQTVRTGADGTATVNLTPPKAGLYHVGARARDGRGNTVASGTSLYISGREFVNWRQDNNDRIALIADKRSYKAGEVAKILIPSPYTRSVGLLTVERGNVLEHRLLATVGNSDTIDVPITEPMLPNVYVSVLLFRGATSQEPADFKLGYVELKVDDAPRRLQIALTPDRKQYAPRDTARFTVKVTDSAGQPVVAALAAALVDASALSLGEAPTAITEAFYRRRPLGVTTAASLNRSLDRLAAAAAPAGKGGGGGEGDVRSNFVDLAYWAPDLRTNQDGEVSFETKLPDNLTTWRLTVRGITVDTKIGEQTSDIVVTKDLLVRPAVPRFLVVGDQARLEAVVNNRTNSERDVQVTLAATGLAGERPARTVKVPANGSAKVGWDLKATGEPVKLAFRASGGGLSDALEITLPVEPATTPETVATLGQVEDRAVEQIHPPLGANRDQGGLTVQVDPSLASGLPPSLKFLKSYPYEATEVTISRFVANLMTLRAFRKLALNDPDMEKSLSESVSPALQKLYAQQRPDGGWPWWPGGDSDVFLTAYALFGMGKAEEAGFPVDPNATKRAGDYLTKYLSGASGEENLRAFVLYALGEAGRDDGPRVNNLYDQGRSQLGNYGRALLALALARTSGGADPRIKALVSELNSAAQLSATGAHWEEAKPDFRTFNTNNRSTSIVLNALVALDPMNALIPQAVRWLMVSRREGHWETTQETAWAVFALSNYLAATPDQGKPSAYTVALNGKTLAQGNTPAGAFPQSAEVSVALRDLALGADNPLTLERTGGAGPLYYAATLRYFVPGTGAQSANHGLAVGRRYTALGNEQTAVTSANAGQTLRVTLTIVAPQDLHYVVIEDPLPAGAEAVDLSLKTTSQAARADLGRGSWRFTHTDLRDDRAVVFATFLPRGTYEYTYLLRATTPGTYQLRPPTALETYFPDVWGRGDGATFTIR